MSLTVATFLKQLEAYAHSCFPAWTGARENFFILRYKNLYFIIVIILINTESHLAVVAEVVKSTAMLLQAESRRLRSFTLA